MWWNELPDHNTPEELLGLLAIPATKTKSDTVVLRFGIDAYEVDPMEHRSEILIQTVTSGAVWVQFGDNPVLTPGTGLRLEGAFSLRLSEKIKITLIPDTVDISVFILQLGV